MDALWIILIVGLVVLLAMGGLYVKIKGGMLPPPPPPPPPPPGAPPPPPPPALSLPPTLPPRAQQPRGPVVTFTQDARVIKVNIQNSGCDSILLLALEKCDPIERPQLEQFLRGKILGCDARRGICATTVASYSTITQGHKLHKNPYYQDYLPDSNAYDPILYKQYPSTVRVLPMDMTEWEVETGLAGKAHFARYRSRIETVYIPRLKGQLPPGAQRLQNWGQAMKERGFTPPFNIRYIYDNGVEIRIDFSNQSVEWVSPFEGKIQSVKIRPPGEQTGLDGKILSAVYMPSADKYDWVSALGNASKDLYIVSAAIAFQAKNIIDGNNKSVFIWSNDGCTKLLAVAFGIIVADCGDKSGIGNLEDCNFHIPRGLFDQFNG